MRKPVLAVIIPALDEEQTIGDVVASISKRIDRVVVADNGSSDRTGQVAADAGAEVVIEKERGYGAACLRAMRALDSGDEPFAVAFMDGDLSDDAADLDALLAPILDQNYDMVIGSRVRGSCETGALTIPQRFGNSLACFLIRTFFGDSYTDLGPMRALKWTSLKQLDMDDRGFGWTVQMQVRAAIQGMKTLEIPVNYRRRRAGKSKVSGTIKGVIGAGSTILFVILKEACLAKVNAVAEANASRI